MVNFIYQEIIIFTNMNEILPNIIKNIFYTNYKIIELTNNEQVTSSVFLEQIPIKESRNETILNYCEGVNPNSIVMFTDDITNELIHSINTRFLENKFRVLNEYPRFWACKNITLHNIKKHKSYDELDTLFIADGDVDEMICKYVPTKTHVIMATYKRNNNLNRIFQMLLEQTDKNFRFHLLDNNTENVIQQELDDIVKKYQDKLDIVLYQNNFNQHCIARMMLIKKLLDTCYLEYVIIFDDDQIHHNDWIETMVEKCEPLSTLSWYGKVFKTCDYWNNIENTDQILTYGDIEFHRKPEINKFKYFGPGGCIFDANLFLFNELYNYDKYSDQIFRLDDLWMSFIFDKYLNVPFHRFIYHPKECIDRNNRQAMTWFHCIEDKPILMRLLSEKYDWDVIKEQRELVTINQHFSKIYVLFSNYANLEQIKRRFIDMNIAACFVYYTDEQSALLNICEKNKNNSIVIFNESVQFEPFFHHIFDKNRSLSMNMGNFRNRRRIKMRVF